MTRPSTDHVTVNDDIADGTELYCRHCGESHHPILPIPALTLAERIRGFVMMHRLCPKPEMPSPQLPLPGTERDTFTTRHGDVIDLGPGISASTDEPAPEIDPPGPYQLFREMYPLATNTLSLTGDVRIALGSAHADVPLHDGISKWHPASGIFNAVANWARIEKAHADAYAAAQRGEPGKGGLTIPRREPMPEKLAELLGVKPKQKKGARPLVNPKRKGKTATP